MQEAQPAGETAPIRPAARSPGPSPSPAGVRDKSPVPACSSSFTRRPTHLPIAWSSSSLLPLRLLAWPQFFTPLVRLSRSLLAAYLPIPCVQFLLPSPPPPSSLYTALRGTYIFEHRASSIEHRASFVDRPAVRERQQAPVSANQHCTAVLVSRPVNTVGCCCCRTPPTRATQTPNPPPLQLPSPTPPPRHQIRS